jgi:single-strand DNA-binding protein
VQINRVVLTGNLTRDPEVRAAGSVPVCKLGVACNTRRKNPATGEWEDKPNFFRVVVFGNRVASCVQYLAKGRPVAIDGRLDWSQYEVDGQRRESIEIIAESIQFLPSRDHDAAESPPHGTSDIPNGDGHAPAALVGHADAEDIPF